MRPDLKERANCETGWGHSRLLRMNRKGLKEGMSSTHSHTKRVVARVSKQGAVSEASQHQVTQDLGGSCKKFGFYPKCSGKPLEGFKQENERKDLLYIIKRLL